LKFKKTTEAVAISKNKKNIFIKINWVARLFVFILYRKILNKNDNSSMSNVNFYEFI